MALTPAATDPKRKEILTNIKKMAESDIGRDALAKDFNMQVTNDFKIEVKDTVTKEPAQEVDEPVKKGTVSKKENSAAETKKI